MKMGIPGCFQQKSDLPQLVLWMSCPKKEIFVEKIHVNIGLSTTLGEN